MKAFVAALAVLILTGAAVFVFGGGTRAPAPFVVDVAQSPAVVRAALMEIDVTVMSTDFKLPAATVSTAPDDKILWTIPTGDETAGQMQIALTAFDGGKRTRVTAIYAPSALSAAAQVVPGLRDPKMLGDLLEKAVAARVTALDPGVSPAVARRNTTLANEYMTAARTAANPTAIAEGTQAIFNDVSAQMQAQPETSDSPGQDAQDAYAEATDAANAADAEDRSRFTRPMVDTTPSR